MNKIERDMNIFEETSLETITTGKAKGNQCPG